MLNRRRFLFAAPAIVAASTLMPISVRAIVVPARWYLRGPVLQLVEVDAFGNFTSATPVDPRSDFWWALVDPKNNGWQRVSEEEAKHFPVVECRLPCAISRSAIERDLYGK